jgi:hypothetical protein
MKNLILAFAAIFAFATASIAQNAAPAPAPPAKEAKGKAKGQAKAAANALGLSAEQQTAFDALHKANDAAHKALDKEKLDAAAKTAKRAELKAKYEADVKGVLNDEQYTKWMAKRAGRAEAKAEKKAQHGKKGAAKGDKAPQPEAK